MIREGGAYHICCQHIPNSAGAACTMDCGLVRLGSKHRMMLGLPNGWLLASEEGD